MYINLMWFWQGDKFSEKISQMVIHTEEKNEIRQMIFVCSQRIIRRDVSSKLTIEQRPERNERKP